MPIQVLMPALSPTMEEGKLAKWLVKAGDKVTSGMVMAEIETDKATMEVEVVDEGIVGRILVEEGAEGVKVNAAIAILLEDGEDASALEATAAAASVRKPEPAQQAATRPMPQPEPRRVAPERLPAEPGTLPQVAAGGEKAGRVFASPLARRMARDRGVSLETLSGTGPHGRIVKRDVESAKSGVSGGSAEEKQTAGGTALSPQRGSQAASPAVGAHTMQPIADDKILALYEPGTYEVVPHDGMRRIIAQRLTQSKQTVPHFYMTVDCTLDELLRARARMNDASPKDGPRTYKLSVNDFVIKALALALQQVPEANATWTEGGSLRHRHSDVGVAVAVEGGLFTPIIRHAEMKTLGEISNEMKDLAGRARNRRLAPHEYQGGTTSISNLGMYGIKSFDAVINPPHATILAVGAGEKRAVVEGDALKVATVMSCTLSCDHRVVDGALAAELLGVFKLLIEDPVRMLV